MNHTRRRIALPRQHWIPGLALLTLLANPGCRRVPKPSSDSTPPTLRWSVFNNETRTTQEIAGSGTVNAKQGESFRVTLFADDPQGIHEITLGSSTSWSCSSGDVGQNHGPSLDATDKQTLQPDSGGNVLTSIFLIRNANLGPFECQSGFKFGGGSVQLFGTGENYFNGVTKGQLTFSVSH